ncbi:hypothetical protein NVP1121O_005 [Vibrio phage 1.121.O._10N.286.46.C4]|nr:hypothetical protein NVP1121O_005 [Vibrio phage 1.121.O._10N.286.46.C4]
MRSKIESIMKEELFFTDEEVAKTIKATIKKVDIVMKDQGVSEDSAINYVLMGEFL